jgi:hypothetical protein
MVSWRKGIFCTLFLFCILVFCGTKIPPRFQVPFDAKTTTAGCRKYAKIQVSLQITGKDASFSTPFLQEITTAFFELKAIKRLLYTVAIGYS